jgi:ABC-type transport system involved in multi-copper enzyme maturation permease subunit
MQKKSLFRKNGWLFLPVSFNAWMLLIATFGVCVKASAAGVALLPGEILIAIIAFSIPAILFYYWVAAHSSIHHQE